MIRAGVFIGIDQTGGCSAVSATEQKVFDKRTRYFHRDTR